MLALGINPTARATAARLARTGGPLRTTPTPLAHSSNVRPRRCWGLLKPRGARFGTEGSDFRILSHRPKHINEYGPRLTFIVGRGPLLLVIVDTFAKRSQQFIII